MYSNGIYFAHFDTNCDQLVLLTWQVAAVNVEVGTQVWVEDPDVAWIDGEVIEVNGNQIKVNCTSGKMVSTHN